MKISIEDEKLEKWADEICAKAIYKNIDSALIFNYVKKLESIIDDVSTRLEYYLIGNIAIESDPDKINEELKKMLKILKGEYYKNDK